MKTVDVLFRCPLCLDYRFGYSGDEGSCHGEDGCGFEWHRRDEWKCFVQIHEYESREEYEEDQGKPVFEEPERND